MNKQTSEDCEVIAPANKLDKPLRYSDDEIMFPDGVIAGATVKFTIFINDETAITSTRFVTSGNSNHLLLADHTGKADGIINITHGTRECFACLQGYADPLCKGDNCTGIVEFDDLEYIDNQGVNFGDIVALEVINP